MSIADTANSIYYNGYTYSIGDLVTLKDRKLYKDSYGPSYITVDGDYVWKIEQIYPTQEVKIFVRYESGSDYYQGYSGFVYPSQIKSGGTPVQTTLIFNVNGGTPQINSINIRYNSKDYYSYGDLVPRRTGYSFNGYYTADGIKVYDSNGRCVNGTGYWKNDTWIYTGSSLNLYAQWSANNYVITLNSNGGIVSNSEVTVTYETGNYNVINDRIPKREGYSFKGWYNAEYGGTQVYDRNGNAVNGTYWSGNANNAYWIYAGNVTIYAQWIVNQYTLTVNPNGGTWNNLTEPSYYAQDYGSEKEIPNPTRVGYSFSGWTLSGSGSLNNTIFTYGAGNATLTAKWTRIQLTVTFNASINGGSPNSTRNVYYGDTVGSLPVPSKPFYKFIGWFTKAVGGTQISANNVITSNVTFYAQYKIDASVKVKYNGNNLPAIVWVKVNGVWKKCITWIKDNGKWNKSTGAD